MDVDTGSPMMQAPWGVHGSRKRGHGESATNGCGATAVSPLAAGVQIARQGAATPSISAASTPTSRSARSVANVDTADEGRLCADARETAPTKPVPLRPKGVIPTLNFASLGVQRQSSGNRPNADSPREGRDFDEVTLVGEEMRQDPASHVEKSAHTCCSAHEGLVELRQRINVLELFGSVEQSAAQAALESKLCAATDVGRGPVPVAGLLRQLPDPLEYQLSPEATVAALQQMRWVLVATVTHMGSVEQDAVMAREDVLGSEREHKRLCNKVDDLADTIMRAEGYRAEEKSHAALREVRMATAEAHFAHGISHVRDLLVECGNQVLAMKADLEKLIPRLAADEDDDEPGAPAAAAYKSHSGGILDVLEDLKEKAEEQLTGLRKAETNAKHNYEMLKQSLEDQVAADSKDMDETKAAKAAAEEAKATAEGELVETVRELANSKSALETVSSDCMQSAADHEATMKARAEELKVIAEAKKILVETTTGAVDQAYSFLQKQQYQTLSHLHTRSDLANVEVLTLIKKLAREHHSAALAQLASRIGANTGFEIKTATAKKGKLEATIGEEAGEISAAGTKFEELAGSIATDEADLKSATSVRAKESADFMASEAELMDVIDTLGRAITVIYREMAKNPAAFAQTNTKTISGLVKTLSTIVDAASFFLQDKNKGQSTRRSMH